MRNLLPNCTPCFYSRNGRIMQFFLNIIELLILETCNNADCKVPVKGKINCQEKCRLPSWPKYSRQTVVFL